MTKFAVSVWSLWNMRRAEQYFAGRPVRYSSPSSQATAPPVLRFHRRYYTSHTHASVNIHACSRAHVVPPAFVVEARWHDAAVIDVHGELPSRWLQKLISDIAIVGNTTAIDSECRHSGRNSSVKLALYINAKLNLIISSTYYIVW